MGDPSSNVQLQFKCELGIIWPHQWRIIMPRSKSPAGVRRGRPTALATLPTLALKEELERRQTMLHELVRQRDELNAELEALGFGANAAVSTRTIDVRRTAGKPQTSGQGTRLRNGQNLVSALQGVLNGKTMSVSELEAAVRKSGYKTKSSNFRVIVNQALIAHPKVFRKVERGFYTTR
jgi:transposase